MEEWMCVLFCVNYLGEAKEMRGFWDLVMREREENKVLYIRLKSNLVFPLPSPHNTSNKSPSFHICHP
jgi:hypothetical protein